MSGPPSKALPTPPGAAGAKGEEDGPGTDGYKAPAKVGLQELMQKDSGDEALRKYKESLLGEAAKGAVAVDPNDKRRVVITELTILFHDRPDGNITYKFNSEEDVKAMKKKPFVLKEKCIYKLQVCFRVQHEIVSGLRFINKHYKAGIRVNRDEEVLGSYAPKAESYTITFPRQEWDEAPSGWLARGGYTAQMKFTDDDGVIHLQFDYAFSINSGWK